MKRTLGSMIIIATLVLALRDDGDRALAEEPPLVPPPVATEVQPVMQPVMQPTGTEVLASGAGLAVVGCDGIVTQALAELDYWRAKASSTTPVATTIAATPAQGTPAVAPTIAAAPIVPAPSLDRGMLGGTGIDPLDRPRIAQVAAALKEMKAQDAALVVADWDDALATEVLSRLPARASGAIATALPPAHAARLYARLSLLAAAKETP